MHVLFHNLSIIIDFYKYFNFFKIFKKKYINKLKIKHFKLDL